jgi:DNA-binding MarR family transcriptional regulator
MARKTGTDLRLKKDTRAFYEALSHMLRLYQFRDRDRICCHEVTVTQCYALEALAKEAVTLNEIAAHLYLDKSTMSRVIDALERKGYASRSTHPDDGRSVVVEITEAGRSLHSKIVGEILAEEETMLAAFSPEVRRAMTKLLSELAWSAERRMECRPAACAAK